jgi:hypothetical protein
MILRKKPKPLVTNYFTPSLIVVSVNEGQLNLGSGWDVGRPVCDRLAEISNFGAAKESMSRELG